MIVMRKSILILMVVLFLPFTIFSQVDIMVGTRSGADNSFPFSNYYSHSYTQTIYPASSINQAGDILSIAWNCDNASSLTLDSLKIYMGVSATIGNSLSGFIPEENLTLVYAGANVTIGANTGWETFVLTTPFFYNGTDNLVVAVSKSTGSYQFSLSYQYFSLGNIYSSIYRRDDSDISCANNPYPNSPQGTSGNLPVIKLSMGMDDITCPSPTEFTINNITDNSAELSWNAGANETTWDIYLTTEENDVPTMETQPTFTTTATHYTLTDLSASDNYYVYVRANCGGGEYSFWRSIAFQTPQLSAQLPYFCNFEDPSEVSQWTISGEQTNRWAIGNAVNATDEGSSALYISNDNGVSNNYTTTSTSTAWAYRDIYLDSTYGEYFVTFKFKGAGESQYYDNLKVYLGPRVTPPATATLSGANLEGSVLLGTFVNSLEWTDCSFNINSSFSGDKRLYFLWWNNDYSGSSPAAAVDDIEIVGLDCGRPYHLTMDSDLLTETTIGFHFTPALTTDNNWETVILAPNELLEEASVISLSDTNYLFANLTPDTYYRIYVRTLCGGTYSDWSEVLGVRTACPAYMNIPYAENFDTYGGTGAGYFPTCWTQYPQSGSYPRISGTTPNSGIGCLQLYSSIYSYSQNYSGAILPQIDTATYPLNSLTVSFKVKRTSTTSGEGALQLGAMTDPNDFSTFTLIQNFSGSEWETANTWYDVEIPLVDYEGYGSYLVLYKNSTTGNSTYIDDLSIYPSPTCVKPVAVMVSQITDQTAVVEWTARNEETEWYVVAVPSGADVEEGIMELVTENPCLITGLTANTLYDLYVKSICSNDDVSDWSTVVSFKTQCAATDVIPYFENFDTYQSGSDQFPACWRGYSNGLTSKPYVTQTYFFNGDGSLYLPQSSTNYSLATSQSIDLSAYDAQMLHVTFLARKGMSYAGRLDVGIMTDPGDLRTFTLLRSIYPTDYSDTYAWDFFDVPLITSSENIYIAFLALQGEQGYICIDSVVVDYVPLCTPPSNLVANNVLGTSARLTWERAPYNVYDYKVEYTEVGSDNWTEVASSIYETSYILSGLAPQTQYMARVSSNCANGAQMNDTVIFTTQCLVGGDISVGNGTNNSSELPSRTNSKFAISQQLFTENEMISARNISGIKIFVSTPNSQPRNWDIYLGNTSQTDLSQGTYIQTTNHSKVFSGQVATTSNGWLEITFDSTFFYTGDNLVLTIDDNSNSTAGIAYFRSHPSVRSLYVYDYLDINPATIGSAYETIYRNDVVFVSPCDTTATCIEPAVYVTEVGSESITIEWAPGYQENSWELEYRALTSSAWTNMGSVSISPYTINNLLPETTYEIRMRSECGSEQSIWTTVTAVTECDLISSLPYVQNFDNAQGSGAQYFIDCWGRGSNGTISYPFTNASQANSPSYSLYFKGSNTEYSYAVTPRIDESIDIANLQISFYALKSGNNSFIEVGIMSNPNDYSTFEVIGSFSPTANMTWELGEVNTSHYRGMGRYIAFRAPQWIYNLIFLDDVDIHEMPYCGRVDDITTNNITTTSATVSWYPGGNENSWEYLLGEAGTIDYTSLVPEMIIGTPEVIFSDLTPNTLYEFAVRMVCDNGDFGVWSSTTFRTGCSDIDNLPFIEDFNDMELGASAPIYCWNKISTYGEGYPYIQNLFGEKSLYFYGTNSSFSLISLPPLSENYNANTLQVTFKMRVNELNSKMIVGVMTAPNDMATFVPIDTIACTTTNTWNLQDVLLHSYSGNGRYIALKSLHPNTCACYIDDIIVDLIPTCPRPTNLSVVSSETDVITLSWTDTTAHEWDLIYAPQGFDPNNAEIATLISGLTTTSCSVSNLIPGVVYDFYVRANCESGDESPWCHEPATTAPFTIAMERVGSNVVEGCTLHIVDDGGLNGDYSHNSHYVLTINPDEGYVISLSGTFAGEANYDYLRIYDGDEVNDERHLGSVICGISGETVTFGPFVSERGPITILFHSDGTNAYEGFSMLATCVAPAGCGRALDFVTDGVNATEADIRWTTIGDTPNSFTLALSTEANFLPDTCTNLFTTTSSNFHFTSLTPNTIYYVRVQSQCGSEVSNWSDIHSFMTSAYPAQVPYLSNFADSLEVENWIIYNDTYVNKWFIGQPNGAIAPQLYVSNDNGNTNAYTNNETSVVWACRDIAFGNFAEYELSFVWRANGESCCDFIQLFIDDPAVPMISSYSTPKPTETAVALSGKLNQDVTGNRYSVALNAQYANSIKRLYFLWKNDYANGTNPAASIDSIQIVGTICGRPYNLNANSLTTTAADIQFTPANESDVTWEYLFGLESSDLTAQFPIQITDTIISLSGLTQNTTYKLYVRTVCGNGEFSEWSEPYYFQTACGIISEMPYTENFDNYGVGFSSSYPTCWSKLSTHGSYPYIYSTYNSAPGALYFLANNVGTYNVAITPEIDEVLYPINSLQVNFWYRSPNQNAQLIVGVMSDASDYSTFIPVDTIGGLVNNWTEYTIYFSDFIGDGNRIAFLNLCTETASQGYLDDVTIDIAPACLPVNDLTAMNVDITEVTLGWNELGNAMSWNIEYGPEGFVQGEGVVINNVTNPYTITGLTASTAYDFYVQANCNLFEHSEWTSALAVTTLCDVISALPYEENFDTYPDNVDFPMPECWLRNSSNTASAPYPHITTTSTAYNSLYFYTSPNNFTMGTTPKVDSLIPINTLMASFELMKTVDEFSIVVGVISNPEDKSTFVPVDTLSPSVVGHWEEFEILFDTYAGNGQYIAFLLESSSYVAIYLDNFVLNTIPSCFAPVDVITSNVTETSATISWTERNNATSWNVEYGPAGFAQGTGTLLQGVTQPCSISSLLPSTVYDVYVQSVCSSTDLSAWSDIVSFITDCAPKPIPYTENFDTYPGTTHSDAGVVPLCWEAFTDNTTRPAPHIIGSGSYHWPTSQPNALSFVGGAPATQAFAILPSFSASLNTLQISFAYAMEDVTKGVLKVGYVTDDNAPASSFVEVATINSSTTIANDTISFEIITATNGRIAFQWSYIGELYYSCNIDDVVVSEIPTACAIPTNVQVVPAATSATISWSSPEEAWVVEYKAANTNNWTASTLLNITNYTISNLQPNTDYVVRVKSVCGNNNESPWSAEVPFTTLTESENTYTIIASASGPGTIMPSGEITVNAGENMTFTFVANVDAVVDRILVDNMDIATPDDNSYTFSNVVANHTIAVEFVNETDIDEFNPEAVLLLYPNPATSQVQIKWTDSRFVGAEMQIFDVYGKLITVEKIEKKTSQIDISQWANGIYFIRVNSSEGVVTKRFVKQ